MSPTPQHPRNAEGVDFSVSAFKFFLNGGFPDSWSLIPVDGKATYVENWAEQRLTREQFISIYKSNSAYRGVGVLTGELSGGLIAIDIDGPLADERFKVALGDAYEAFGEESTMSWTSGKPGRRQMLYRVPSMIVRELAEVTTIILDPESGEWGHGGVEDTKERDKQKGKGEGAKAEAKPEAKAKDKSEEVVLRFNRCQSVLPGSPHPETHQKYHFLNYNNKKVAEAPDWLLDVLRGFREPVQWLSDADQKALDGEYGETILPSRQIRGWFFKEEVQALLRPRLKDLVFKHKVFDEYGWRSRAGRKPQEMSGCPWHDSNSGDAFQFNAVTGCWDCKACHVGGDVLDFVHKIRSNDKHAVRPVGPDLETYVAEIATKLGYDYPSCANKKEVISTSVPRVVMDEEQFHEALVKIYEEEKNPALQIGRMASLAMETGRRLTGTQCLAAMSEYKYYKDAHSKNQDPEWWSKIQRMEFVIPNLIQRPTQIILHAAGGLGKTSACMGLASTIGRGLPMKIRGIELPVNKGPVLWIQNDQSQAKLLEDMEDNGINPAVDKWFHVRRGFQMNHTHQLREWIREIKPALVVIDSIGSCSTMMQVEEREKAFSNPLYWASNANGNLEEGFPACAIVWIHHDNAQGEVRGTRYLINAIDEQWHLRALKDDEREYMRSRGVEPSACRLMEIKKSRMGRQGDQMVVERDQNFSYSVWDMTPTERREDNGQGDPDPMTTVLRLVRDQVVKANDDTVLGEIDPWLTAQEVWEALVNEVTGLGKKPPSKRTVQRWLERWVKQGVLGEFSLPAGQHGRPPSCYTLIYELSRVRVGLPKTAKTKKIAEIPSSARDEFTTEFMTDGGLSQTPEVPPEGGNRSSADTPEGDGSLRHASEGSESVAIPPEAENLVVATDLPTSPPTSPEEFAPDDNFCRPPREGSSEAQAMTDEEIEALLAPPSPEDVPSPPWMEPVESHETEEEMPEDWE